MKTRRHYIIIILLIIMYCLVPVPTYAENEPFDEEEILDEEDYIPHSEEEILKWVAQHVPSGIAELEQLKKEDPREYEYELRAIAEEIGYLEMVKRRYPEMFERLIHAQQLEIESWQLAEKIARTRGNKVKEQLIKELRQILEEIFEIRLAERDVEIQELEKELNEMRTLIEKRQAMKAQIIERRLKDMLPGDDESLDWW